MPFLELTLEQLQTLAEQVTDTELAQKLNSFIQTAQSDGYDEQSIIVIQPNEAPEALQDDFDYAHYYDDSEAELYAGPGGRIEDIF